MTIKQYARPMSAKQLNRELTSLGYATWEEREEFAELIGITGRSLRRYTSGDYEVPIMLAVLLRYATREDVI